MTARKKRAPRTRKRTTAGGSPTPPAPDLPIPASPHKGEIRIHASEARRQADLAQAHASLAIEAAYKAGRLLIEEKLWLEQNFGKKQRDEKTGRVLRNAIPWSVWFDAIIAPAGGVASESDIPPGGSASRPHPGMGGGGVKREEAERYMRLAARHEGQTAFTFDESNVVRSGMLALELFPPKKHEPIPGDRPMPRQGRHLSAVNILVAWWRDITSKFEIADLPLNVRARMITDLAPVAAIVDELRRTPPPGKKTTGDRSSG